MKVRFLGTAAGGGIPQWNCACETCQYARRSGDERTQDCLAISADGDAWYLVNASPDLRTQLARTPELSPGPGVRDTPLRGVLLTTAELDHTLGLLSLREAARLSVYATRPVLAALPWLPVLGAYTALDTHVMSCGEPFHLDGGLTVTPIALGSKRPRYLSDHPPSDDWVIGLRFTDTRGRSLIYASCLASWASAVTSADIAVLDGTFFAAGEIAGVPGHLPIQESLPHLRSHPRPRYLYTHLNNTNLAAQPTGPHRTFIASAGAEIAPEAGLIEF